MKIAYLTHDLDEKTGWGMFASQIINALEKEGHETVVLTEREGGAREHAILKRGFAVFKAAWRARAYIKDCDVVHALDGYPFGIIAALATLGMRKPKLVITLVGTYSVAPLYNVKTAALLKWAYRRADIVTSISRYTKDRVIEKVKLRDVRIIHPGVEMPATHQAEKGSEKFILGVGAVKYRKGYHISLEAFAHVLKRHPELMYTIVGDLADTAYVESLKALARKLGIEEKVKFVGKVSRDELERLYTGAELFVLTSVNKGNHFEGFGIVYLEANARGLAVVGCRGSGAEDAIVDEETGLLAHEADPEGVAQAIERILGDASLKDRLSHKGKVWAEEHRLQNVGNKYLALYSE